MIVSKCCNEPIYGIMVGEGDSIYCCELCDHRCEGEGDTYDDESPHEVAEQFNLEYLATKDNLMYFNDLETKSTVTVYDLSELEDKITESRKKFKGE